MRLHLLMLILFLSSNAFAVGPFNYHGIKAEMTKEEVNALFSCTKYCSSMDYKQLKVYFGKIKKFPPPMLRQISFSYTSDGKLWGIQLDFLEDSGTRKIAQQRVLTKLYPDVELSTRTERGEHITMDFITARIVDSFLFKADVEKIYQQTISMY